MDVFIINNKCNYNNDNLINFKTDNINIIISSLLYTLANKKYDKFKYIIDNINILYTNHKDYDIIVKNIISYIYNMDPTYKLEISNKLNILKILLQLLPNNEHCVNEHCVNDNEHCIINKPLFDWDCNKDSDVEDFKSLFCKNSLQDINILILLNILVIKHFKSKLDVYVISNNKTNDIIDYIKLIKLNQNELKQVIDDILYLNDNNQKNKIILKLLDDYKYNNDLIDESIIYKACKYNNYSILLKILSNKIKLTYKLYNYLKYKLTFINSFQNQTIINKILNLIEWE